MVKVVELQEPFPEDEVPSQARSNSVNLERVFLLEKCRKGFPVTCVVGFGSVVLPTKKWRFDKEGTFGCWKRVFFRMVVSFGKEVRINGQDEQV